jgi:large subunit ribosomal protein L18
MKQGKNDSLRLRRKRRIRKKVVGTAERPRLSVFRSLRQIFGQVINDAEGKTIAAAGSDDQEVVGLVSEKKGNMTSSKAVGALIAQRTLAKGIRRVVFDRGGYLYHGRVKALAEGAREGGLEF